MHTVSMLLYRINFYSFNIWTDISFLALDNNCLNQGKSSTYRAYETLSLDQFIWYRVICLLVKAIFVAVEGGPETLPSWDLFKQLQKKQVHYGAGPYNLGICTHE